MSVEWLFEVIEDRKKNPSKKSYTSISLPKACQGSRKKLARRARRS